MVFKWGGVEKEEDSVFTGEGSSDNFTFSIPRMKSLGIFYWGAVRWGSEYGMNHNSGSPDSCLGL